MKKIYFIFIQVLIWNLISFNAISQLYWRTDGSNFLLINPVWGTSAAGPFTNNWVNNSNIFITGSGGNAITNVTNTPVGNITITGSAVTNWGNAGTFSTGGNIRTIDIGAGSILTWNNQNISTAAGTGFIKNGTGSWNIGSQSGAFTGGFTLNNGTIVIGGDIAVGTGIFTINGGTIQSSSTRDMAVSSIVVGGDFEHSGSGNATWSMNMALGTATRSMLNTTASGSRRFTGIVSGATGTGMIFNGPGLAQTYFGNAANTFSGAITINGGEVVFSSDGSLGTGTSITLDGGRLTFAVVDALGNNTYVTSGVVNAGRTIYIGGTTGTAISVPGATGIVTLNAAITDKAATVGTWAKQGAGRLNISGTCTYSGNTLINNGTIQLATANNRLPVNTVVYVGQAASTNLGTLDLNGLNQQVAGLYSVAGINAGAVKNTITSSSAAVLNVSGKGKFGDGTLINSGVITGAVSLIKSGTDTLELADANTYTGTTTVSGGVLRLNKTGGITIPVNSNMSITGGTLRISTNQVLNNLAVTSGTLLVDAGVTLTISGTYSGGGTITNNGTIIINAVNTFPGTTSTVTAGFNNLTAGAAVSLDKSIIINGSLVLNSVFNVGNYTLTLNGPAITGTPTNLSTTMASSLVFGGTSNGVFIPSSVLQLSNLTIGNSSNVSLNSMADVYNSVTLTVGTLAITAGNKLTFNGASLTAGGGYISGSNTSDLAVIGTTGGTINLPAASNISLRNITVSGNRILRLNGVNHIALSGALTIAAGSTFDNGGESQLINNTGGSIAITGTFITRDIQGFFASNAAIPGIVPVLNTGCTIEYALTGNQAVQGSTVAYKNVRFSGSGVKLLASPTAPAGTVFITGTAIVNTNGFNFGGASTALTMDGGRLIVTTTGTQPAMQLTYNLTGGVVEFKGASAQTIRTNTYQNIEVTGAGVSNSSGNITLRNSGTFIVTATGTFLINDNCITGIAPATGTQTVTVQPGGLFRSGNNQGFNGFTATLTDNSSVHSNITNIVLAAGSTVEYSRSADQPITNANGLVYHHILLSGTAGIKTAPAGSLSINGNITKTGSVSFAHNNGKVIISGTALQTYASTTPVIQFYNLELMNTTGFATASDMTIVKELSFNDDVKLNLQAGYITLKSDASGTANVGIIPVTASINYLANTGFIVERYIATGTTTGQHTKSWQLLSVPVNGGQSVRNGWQESSLAPNDNIKPGYGTQITSSLAGATGLGFDAFSSGGPSMKTYNSAGAGSYAGIPNTGSNALYNVKGYMIFIRGDRSVVNFSGANSTALPTILRSTGKLFAPVSNPPTATTVPGGKFESVGNPYASAIDLTVFADYRTGDIQDIYYVWDPTLTIVGAGSAYGYGGWRTLSRNGASYDVTPAGGNYGSSTKFIQSGQAFFVRSFSTGGTVNFGENCKVPDYALQTRFPGSAVTQLRTNLYVSTQSGKILLDGVLTNLKNTFSNRLEKDDAYKMNMQTGESISIYSNDTTLSVECRQMVNTSDTIHFKMSQLRQQTYYFEFLPQQFAATGLQAFLDDKYLQIQTPVSLFDTTMISFVTESSSPLSMAADRFSIVFKRRRSTLPFEFLDIAATHATNQVDISWKVKNDAALFSYEIEQGSNAANFKSMKTVPLQLSLSNENSYDFTLNETLSGKTYFRVKANSLDGSNVYSRIVEIDNVLATEAINIYPNPVKDNTIQFYFKQIRQGKQDMELISANGSVVYKTSFVTTGLSKSLVLPVVAKGSYTVKIKADTYGVVAIPVVLQ